MERALIVDHPWIELLLSGVKPWEMRSRHTHIRGRIGLIAKGSGMILGSIELTDSLPLQTYREMVAATAKHHIPNERLKELQNWRYPWVMERPIRFVEPRPYKHPRGAVTWVKL